MKLEQRLELKQAQIQRLSPEQRLELKSLLAIRQELKTPAPPEAATGLEGIGNASAILERKGLRGMLIGSLAVDFWKTTNIDALARHKDVDVAVLPLTERDIDIDLFEGGIDWWLPREAKLEISEADGKRAGTVQWWENGNGVVVGFGLDLNKGDVNRIPLGLSIPTPVWQVEMQIAEIMARKAKIVQVSGAAMDALERKLNKDANPTGMTLKGVLPLKEFALYRFQLGIENIPRNKALALELKAFDLPLLAAIQSQKRRGQ